MECSRDLRQEEAAKETDRTLQEANMPAPRSKKLAPAPAGGKAAARPRKTASRAAHAPKVTPDERQQMIAFAAYLRAERRGFTPGDEMLDWLEAEAEVDTRLDGR